MDLNFEKVGLAKLKAAGAFIMVIILFVACPNANGQSPGYDLRKTRNMWRVDQKNLPGDDLSAVFYQSHPFLSKKPLLNDSTKRNKGSLSDGYKTEDKGFLKEMNRKLDSTWRKFDQRCRKRDKYKARHSYAQGWNIFF